MKFLAVITFSLIVGSFALPYPKVDDPKINDLKVDDPKIDDDSSTPSTLPATELPSDGKVTAAGCFSSFTCFDF